MPAEPFGILNRKMPDFTTSGASEGQINKLLGEGTAQSMDGPSRVKVARRLPTQIKIAYISTLEHTTSSGWAGGGGAPRRAY